MIRVVLAGILLAITMAAMAQDIMEDGSLVVLPLEAQQCDLPSAPPPISENPEKAELLSAQKYVKKFQADMEVYRNCVNQEVDNPDLSTGNQRAISNAYNYSVDMEERVANMFNEAVRAYKANMAKN